MYRSDRFCTKINYQAFSDLVLVALIYCLRIKGCLLSNLFQESQRISLESSHKEEYQAQALSLDLSVPLLSQSRYPKIKREKYYHWIQLICCYISIGYSKKKERRVIDQTNSQYLIIKRRGIFINWLLVNGATSSFRDSNLEIWRIMSANC